ncbi:MAG: endonuclease/exonuclease/phosphatase family protein [Pseudomonadota bacterium]
MRRKSQAMAVMFAGLVASTAAATALDLPVKPDGAIRFATYNVALAGETAGGIIERLTTLDDPQATRSAAVIQAVRPDVLLVQELDRDDDGRALSLYAGNYLARPQDGGEAINYPHRVLLPTNTGVPSGVDLDGDGEIGGEGIDHAVDALGFGRYPGQYAFALLSMLPVGEPRTFTEFLWRDMPGHRMAPDISEAVREVLPLSSKTHALIPVEVGETVITVVAAHPTPPIRPPLVPRNADEIRLVVDLLHEARSQYAIDDKGVRGGLAPGGSAVVMGDLNADPRPEAGNSAVGAIRYLLDDPAVIDPEPRSDEAGTATAAFSIGQLRVDYVVPTADLEVLQSGVYWPPEGDPAHEASDHYLVWVDVRPRSVAK